jgi:hypothetical protein
MLIYDLPPVECKRLGEDEERILMLRKYRVELPNVATPLA